MFRIPSFLAAVLTLLSLTGRAWAGAWTTHIRPGELVDLLARDDEVWGATDQAGLLRWALPGYGLEVIRREPGSISSNRLSSLARDASGRIWVGTLGAGANRLSADRRRWDLLNHFDGLPSDSVTVLEAVKDTLWIGTTKGIALWNGREVSGALPDGLTASFDTTFANVSVTGVAMTDDRVWVSTRSGVGVAHRSAALADWRPVNQGLADLDVQALAFDGVSLFAHSGLVAYRWREDLGRWEPEPGAGTVHRLMDDNGMVLAGGESGVLRWFLTAQDSGWTALPGAPAASGATGADPEAAVAPDGVAFAALAESVFAAPASPGAWVRLPLPPMPPGNNLAQIALQGSTVYVTTRDRGTGRWDARGWRVWSGQCPGGCDTTFLNGIEQLGLLVDRQGLKWVASWVSAIESFDDSAEPALFTRHVVNVDEATWRRTWAVSAAVDSSGHHWFGMDSPFMPDIQPAGLEHYDAQGDYVGNLNSLNSGLRGDLIRALTVAGGRLWIGYSDRGLDYADLPLNPSAIVTLNTTVSEPVRALAAYGDSVWMLTSSELWRFPADAGPNATPLETIRVRGGPPSLAIHAMDVGPDGRVWVGTAEGIRSFGPGAERDSFNVANSPLPEDEVRAVAVDRRTGVVWMTTPGGLASFDPSYTPPPEPPLPSLRVRLSPNPARLSALGVQLRIDGDAEDYRGEVYDIGGRRLARFSAQEGGLVWNGRDRGGAVVGPGVYFVRIEAGGRSATVRVALLR